MANFYRNINNIIGDIYMATIETYPHFTINVQDNTIYEPVVFTKLPLHRPLHVIKAQKGLLDTIQYMPQFTSATKEFGERTFDKNDKRYFSTSAYYLNKSFPNNGAFIMRVAGDTAKESVSILEVQVENKDIVQYVKDSLGNYILSDGTTLHPDGSTLPAGDPVPVDDGGAALVTPGVALRWSTRSELTAGEIAAGVTYDSLHKIQPYTVGSTTTYPVLAYKSTNPGGWGNDIGFELYYNSDINGVDIASRQGGVTYSLVVDEINRNTNTVSAKRNKYNSIVTSFVLKSEAIDMATQLDVSMDAIVENAFSGANRLPYSIIGFDENVQQVGRICLDAMEAAVTAGVNPHVADIGIRLGQMLDGNYVNSISGRDLDNKPYDVIKVEEFVTNTLQTKAVMAQDVTHFLEGGLDGDISRVAIEEKIRAFYKGNSLPEIEDQARFPITHIFDAGYTLPTKYSMLEFLDLRPDVKSVIGTHIDIGNIDYTSVKAYDTTAADRLAGDTIIILTGDHSADIKLAVGMNVYASGVSDGTTIKTITVVAGDTEIELTKALVEQSTGVMPFVVGFGAITAVWDAQTDIGLVSTLSTRARMARESIIKGTAACRATVFSQCGIPHDYNAWVSTVLWSVVKKSEYQNIDYFDRVPEGLPFSEVNLFKRFNWTPSGSTLKSLVWDDGGNYCQYYDMDAMHYPSVRSVYPYNTSVLVDDIFTDAIVYTKHEVRKCWARHTGKTIPFEILSQDIEEDLQSVLVDMYNGRYKVLVDVVETEEDMKMGDRLHVNVTITSPGTKRVWDVTLFVNRDNFNVGGGE